ncbi:TlpA family protein disulfide reductase [Pedobacter sp. NJ-S-72]
MKKLTINIVLALLCLNFNGYTQQDKPVVPNKNGLQIGQKVPDILLKNMHNYKKTKTAKISDFEGKLLILDFWATWCSPCVAMLPKMDLLQRKFDGKLQFLSVTYQAEKEVLPFLTLFTEQQKAGYTIPSIFEDQDLHLLFPHQQLPHYVWIGPDGIVKAITGDDEITEAIITESLTNKTMKLAVKADVISKVPFDRTKPFLINNNGGDGKNLVYHSVFAGYSDDLGNGGFFGPSTRTQGKRVVIFNSSIPWFYKCAYGEGSFKFNNSNRVVFEVRDAGKLNCDMEGAPATEWMKQGNVFTYELFVPAYMANQFFQIMKEDLKRFFPQYKAKVEMRMVKCLALTRTTSDDKIKTKDPLAKPVMDFDPTGMKLENISLEAFVDQLQFFYQQLLQCRLLMKLTIKAKLTS